MTLQTRAPPNRFLTQYHWDEDELNQRRLELLQSMKETQWHRNGVVAIDDTLLSKTGEEIPGAEKFWDHNSNSYLYGQSLVTSHYIDLDKDYPIDFRQYFKQGSLEAVKYGFRTKVDLALELVDYCEALGIPVETYVFDAWFLCRKLTNHIESYEKSWVGRLKVEPHRSTTRTKG